MPQNAIIRADGTGDYTTPQAWEAAEQSSNYGSITVGRVDGFFDSGSSQLDINGTWPNGARLEPFDPADAFDGTERQLCGITSTGITIRGRGKKTELEGLEIYSTSGSAAYSATSGGGDTSIIGCLLRTNSGTNNLNSSNGLGYSNCVVASNSSAVYGGTTVGSGNSLFANRTGALGSTSSTTLSNTVAYNKNTGTCFRGSVTQTNNASSDGTADTLTNIVIADNFVNADPLVSGDYRIKLGSDLDTNGIGSFVESGGGAISVTESLTALTIDTFNPSIDFTGVVSVTESLTNLNLNSFNPTIGLTATLTVTESLTNLEFNSLDPIVTLTPPNTIIITESTTSLTIDSFDPTITFSGTISVTESLTNLDFRAYRPTVQVGAKEYTNIFYGVAAQQVTFAGTSVSSTFSGTIKQAPDFSGIITTSTFSGVSK